MSLLKLAVLAVIGCSVYAGVNMVLVHRAFKKRERVEVRDARLEQMTSPPQTLSKADEAIDESFPASGPPSTC